MEGKTASAQTKWKQNTARTDSFLQVRDVSFSYGWGFDLSGCSMGLAKGSFTGLLGPNGSGKSTLLKAISGRYAPTTGAVNLAGRDVHLGMGWKERAVKIASLPQQKETPRGLTVFDLVLSGRYAHTRFLEGYGQKDREAARRALAVTGLEGFSRREASNLSGGELQRVWLAQALGQILPEPRMNESPGAANGLLLLDEVAAGLDPAVQVAMFEVLARENRESGLTILSAMHDLNLAALYCEELIFIKQGRILAQGSTEELFTAAMLEAVYDAPATIVRHPTGRPQALLGTGAGEAA